MHQRLWCRWGFDPLLGLIPGVYFEHDHLIRRVEPAALPPPDLKPDEIFSGLLTPGLLNAHAHLNYSAPSGLPGGGFAAWLRSMIELRRAGGASTAQSAAAAADAVEALRRDGVTEIWDIAARPGGEPALRAAGLAAMSFLEVIHPAPRGAAEAMDRVVADWPRHVAACAPEAAGISPHAPYSVAPELLEQLAVWAARAAAPLAMHLAESPEELELLLHHAGPLRATLEWAGGDPCGYVRRGIGPIDLAAQTGLLGPRLLAIHANLPAEHEVDQLARTRTPVVFCPRSHAWFDYPPYPLARYRAAGVRLALGTDSLASNTALSIRGELRLVMEQWPAARDWPATDLLGLATGAALGESAPFGGRGRLAVGCPARFARWELDLPASATPLDALRGLLALPAICPGKTC